MAPVTDRIISSRSALSTLESTEFAHGGSLGFSTQMSPLPHISPTSKQSSPNTNVGIDPRTTYSVLVVEDDPDISMALQDLLEFEGFQVDCVQTCRQAFSSLEHDEYDAVLLDLGLPDGDGRSILEKLQISSPTLPVIVLTASGRDLGSLRAYARLTKPWKRDELCTILRQAIGME